MEIWEYQTSLIFSDGLDARKSDGRSLIPTERLYEEFLFGSLLLRISANQQKSISCGITENEEILLEVFSCQGCSPSCLLPSELCQPNVPVAKVSTLVLRKKCQN